MLNEETVVTQMSGLRIILRTAGLA